MIAGGRGPGAGAPRGLGLEQGGTGAGQIEVCLERGHHRGAGLERAPRQHDGEGSFAEVELARDRTRGQGQLARPGIDQGGRHRVAFVVRALHHAGEGGDAVLGQPLLVDARHEIAHRRHLERFEDDRHDARLRAPSVRGAHRRAQGLVSQPVSGALVREEEAEAARTRGLSGPVLAVGDGAGSGQDDDAHAVRGSRHQRDGGVVDDAHSRDGRAGGGSRG
jgi:hypothetical protein